MYVPGRPMVSANFFDPAAQHHSTIVQSLLLYRFSYDALGAFLRDKLSSPRTIVVLEPAARALSKQTPQASMLLLAFDSVVVSVRSCSGYCTMYYLPHRYPGRTICKDRAASPVYCTCSGIFVLLSIERRRPSRSPRIRGVCVFGKGADFPEGDE